MTFVVFLLDELQGTETQAALLVGLAEEANGLALGAESTDSLLV